MNKIYVLLASVLLQGCDWGLGSNYDSSSETMFVDFYKEACSSTSAEMCFRMRSSAEESFVLSTVDNSGFDNLEWGKRYTLEVEVEYDSDGADSFYRLLNVDSEDDVDAAANDFTLAFNMSSEILLDNLNNSWILAGEDTFTCTDSDCALLTTSYNASEKIQLKFTAQDDQLTLVNVICSAAEADFSSSCDGISETNWDIAHFQTDCGLSEPKLCLVYRENAASNEAWHVLPFDIDDFTAIWGTKYDIEVEGISSGGSVRSAKWLQENNNEDLSDSEFNVVMRTGVQGLDKSSSGMISYDDVAFDCEENLQCDLIDDVVDSADSDSERFIALLTEIEIVDGETSLIIKSITCDETYSDFKANCLDENDDIIWNENP